MLPRQKKTDRKFGNMAIGEVGRMEQKLLNFQRVRGLVVRAFGEISEYFKVLMDVM